MNWRIKLVVGAWLIAAVAGALLVRNLMRGGWKDLPVVSWVVLLPVVLLLFTGSYFLLREARRNSK
jgi:high-affinity Fe2+/Pb2+ permease